MNRAGFQALAVERSEDAGVLLNPGATPVPTALPVGRSISFLYENTEESSTLDQPAFSRRIAISGDMPAWPLMTRDRVWRATPS